MNFVEKLKTLAFEHWGWLAIGVGLTLLLILAMRVRGEGHARKGGWLWAPFQWYAERRWARQLTVNALGVLLILWVGQTFSMWVQPTLTPDMLFTPPVIGPQAVKVAMVEEGPLSDTVTYTGTVLPYEDTVIYARVDGYVEGLNVYPGDRISDGEVLLTIETSELEPRLQHARADVSFWKAEHERDQKLFEAGAISASAFDKTSQQYEVAQARVRLLETQIGYATIRSPVNGWISERKVYPGVYVKKGEPLLKVDRLDRVRIQFDVAEKDLLHFHNGTPVFLRFPQMESKVIRQAFSNLLWTPQKVQLASLGEVVIPPESETVVRSEVAVIFPSEDPSTRTGVVEIRLPNPGVILKSHGYVVGELVRSHVETAIKVPRSALTPMPDGKTVVFVGPAFADQGPAEMREVKVGIRGREYVHIQEGINPGEFVIYEGNRTITNGENVMVVHREGGF